MTAAVYRTATPSLSVPQTQNTAPVLEFNCMYTHDLRRKAKRWQDGFLRYHTFNKRVMVYDVPRNYIGDAHWTAGELQPGDELMLEKDGVMVEVADAVGRTETDLTELRKSAKKSSSERGSSPARAPQMPGVQVSNRTLPRQPTQLKHRSLNALLGTPKGPIGKAALPAKSPFEQRHGNAENDAWEEGRPPKRTRMDGPPAWNVTRTTTVAKPVSRKETPLRARKADAAKQRAKTPVPARQQRLGTHEVIDLRDVEPEPEKFLPGFSSDALVPPTSPPRELSPAEQQSVKATRSARSSSPAFQTQEKSVKEIDQRQHLDEVQEQFERPILAANRDSATARDSSDLSSKTTRNDRRAAEQRSASPAPSKESYEKQSGSTLRIAASTTKKTMLLCQDQLASKPKRISSTNTDDAADALLDAAIDDQQKQSKAKTRRQLLDERLARVNNKQREPVSKQVEEATEPLAAAEGIEVESPAAEVSEQASVARRDEDRPPMNSAVSLAELDRMLLLPEGDKVAKVHNRSRNVTDTRQRIPDEPHFGTSAKDPSLANSANGKPSSPRKKKGMGRREVRASAQPCFQPPPIETRQSSNTPQPEPDADMESTRLLPADLMEQQSAELPPAVSKQDSPPVRRKDQRPFIRSLSDATTLPSGKPKRVPGAPMRFTPSPRKAAVAQAPSAAAQAPPGPPAPKSAPRPPFKAPKKPFQQAASLNTTTSGTAAVMPGRPFQAPKKAMGAEEAVPDAVALVADPWSREAFDLFEWRPPNWDEERWCFKEVATAVNDVANGDS